MWKTGSSLHQNCSRSSRYGKILPRKTMVLFWMNLARGFSAGSGQKNSLFNSSTRWVLLQIWRARHSTHLHFSVPLPVVVEWKHVVLPDETLDFSSVSKQLGSFGWENWLMFSAGGFQPTHLKKFQSQTGKCPCEDQKTNDALPETNIAANKKRFSLLACCKPSRYYGSF